MPIVDHILIQKRNDVIGVEYCCFIYTQNTSAFIGYGLTKHEALDDALRGIRNYIAGLGEQQRAH